MARVYISGPYSSDPEKGTAEALRVGTIIYANGHFPFIPHLSHFWHQRHPMVYERWLEYDLEWLEACDALVRLPGESKGADREVARAKELGMEVYTLAEFLQLLENDNGDSA